MIPRCWVRSLRWKGKDKIQKDEDVDVVEVPKEVEKEEVMSRDKKQDTAEAEEEGAGEKGKAGEEVLEREGGDGEVNVQEAVEQGAKENMVNKRVTGGHKNELEEVRERRLVVKGVKGDSWAMRKEVRKLLEQCLQKEVDVEKIEERKGVQGERFLIVQLKEREDRRQVLQSRERIADNFGVLVDEDLSFEERRARWKIRERAMVERRAGRLVVEESRRLGVDGVWWKWGGEGKEWLRERSEEREAVTKEEAAVRTEEGAEK